MAWASLSTNTKAAVVFYSVYGAVFFIVRPARSLLLSFTWPLLLCVTHACCVLLAHLSCGHSRCCRLSTARPLCACRRRFSDGGGPGGMPAVRVPQSLNITGVYGLGLMPLFPLQLERVGWAFTWLVQTIFDLCASPRSPDRL